MNVPCNGCTRCCWHDAVRILPHEDASQWKTEPHPAGRGTRMLAHKADGSCVYLGEHGCTIQETKPQMCKEMDCRNIARNLTYTQIRKHSRSMGVWRKGKELLKQR